MRPIAQASRKEILSVMPTKAPPKLPPRTYLEKPRYSEDGEENVLPAAVKRRLDAEVAGAPARRHPRRDRQAPDRYGALPPKPRTRIVRVALGDCGVLGARIHYQVIRERDLDDHDKRDDAIRLIGGVWGVLTIADGSATPCPFMVPRTCAYHLRAQASVGRAPGRRAPLPHFTEGHRFVEREDEAPRGGAEEPDRRAPRSFKFPLSTARGPFDSRRRRSRCSPRIGRSAWRRWTPLPSATGWSRTAGSWRASSGVWARCFRRRENRFDDAPRAGSRSTASCAGS